MAPWFVSLVEDADRPVRVLAFPHAGGGCATFAACAALVSPRIALWGLNLPGRHARFGEPHRTDLPRLLNDIVDELPVHTRQPYLLFGYCSGALIAFLLARSIRKAGLPSPAALVVASYPPPQHAVPPPDLHNLPSDSFWERILSYGGVPAVIVEQDGYRELFEETLRADHELLAAYRHAEEPPLTSPIAVVAGRHDPVLSVDRLAAWATQTTARSSLHLVESDHWLLSTGSAEVARILDEQAP